MRALIVELLQREHGCWTPVLVDGESKEALAALEPDLVVMDADRFASDLPGALDAPVVVVGREPDPSSRWAALRRGAGGWVARDCVADELSHVMRAALGCVHAPCPEPALVGGPSVEIRSSNP